MFTLTINPRAHSILIKNSVSEGSYFVVFFTETPFDVFFSILQDLKIMFSELRNYVLSSRSSNSANCWCHQKGSNSTRKPSRFIIILHH